MRTRIAILLAMAVLRMPVQAQPQVQTPVQRLQASIERTTKSVNATWGIYIKSIETGEEIAIGADRRMETMSTIKIPLMVEALEQVKAGKFKLTDKYTFVQADSQPGTGTIQRLDPGAVMTVKDLLTMMIIVSDNTATEVLYRMVGGPDAVNKRLDALGLATTRAMTIPSKWFAANRAAASSEQFYREGKNPFGYSTPREMGRLLEMMERGTLVDKASSDLMLQISAGSCIARASRAMSRATASRTRPAISSRTSATTSVSSKRTAGPSSSASSPAIITDRARCSRTRSA